MVCPRNRILAVVLACGVFCAQPLFGTLPHLCHNRQCENCRLTPSVFISLARAYGDEPKTSLRKPDLSDEAKAALEKLIQGNQRFVANASLNLHSSREWRAKIANEQKPFAAIPGCADPRVPPEIVFDQGLGDLFVVRVAGNVVDSDVTGSLEYAARHFGVQLFVGLGHEHCGAVSAVMAAEKETDEPPGLRFFHQGQFEGRKKRISPHLVRGPQEPVVESLRQFYDRLMTVLRQPAVRDGQWQLLECQPPLIFLHHWPLFAGESGKFLRWHVGLSRRRVWGRSHCHV